MKSLLVIIAILGTTLAQHWGQPGVPADTPEVAAAKASHLAALARANQQPNSYNPQPQSWSQPQQQWSPPQQQWNQQPQQQPRWNGPIALPPGFDQNGAPLPVKDTPEVAAERARHLTLYSGGGHPSLVPAQPSWSSPAPQWNAPAQSQWNAPAPQWNAPAPQWNAPAPQWGAPSQPGLPQDTPEVAAARAAHLAAHAALPPSSNHGRWKRSIIAAPAIATVTTGYSTSVVHSAAPVVRVAAPVIHTAVPLVRTAVPVAVSPIVATHLHATPALSLAHW